MLRISNFLVYLFFLCVLRVLCGETLAEDKPPSPKSISQLISAAQLDRQKFENETFSARMQFELSGRLLNDNDKSSFCGTASIAQEQTVLDIEQQRTTLDQIEKYEGADWEQLYGSAGLWRKLSASVEETKLNKSQIDYYLAIICSQQKEKPLEEILSQLQGPSADLMKAKVLCALSQIDEKYKTPAEKQFAKIKLRSDWNGCEAIEASLEQIKCFGPSNQNELDVLAKSLDESECKDDWELLMSFIILQYKYSPDTLHDSLAQFPKAILPLGKLVLNDLSSRFSQLPPADANFDSIAPFDAELAAAAAWQSNLQLHADLITKLAENQRLQTPAVLYVAGILYRQTRPKKAVELLIKAGNLQSKTEPSLLDVPPDEMAKQAFEIAYQQFQNDPNDCQPAIDAFENYSRFRPEQIDEQSQYLYADLLKNCDRQNDAAKAFEALAKRSQSLWGDAATLELLKMDFHKATTPAESNDVLNRLHDFILRCNRPEERETQIRLEAMNLYCQTLLNQDSPASADKVLQILDTALPTPGLRYELFRAIAFKQLGRLEESAIFMSKAILLDSGPMAPQAVEIASDIIDKIELWRQNAVDLNALLDNCSSLANFAYKVIDNRQTSLLLAEVSVFRSDLNRADDLLKPLTNENDIYWLRPEARLLMAKGDYSRAAQMWSKIAELRRNGLQQQNRKSYGWWQAKFYELDCISKLQTAKSEDLRHTIDVLLNTYTDIPAPWTEKLNGLKKQ
jgi:hypothetical protein